MDLALPFDDSEVHELKSRVIDGMQVNGIRVVTTAEDGADVPIDFRFLDVMLRAAEDPLVGRGGFAGGVRVGSGGIVPPGG